jgi:inosine-uridine nucleoside N-ribohydrolase
VEADSPAPLLVDTDPGIDDALALLLAWGSPELRVHALTTVAGNVPLAEASRNAFRLLDLRRPSPRPVVAAGAAAPLNRPLETAVRYHGADGLGDLGDWPAVRQTPAADSAAALIAGTARRLGGDLTVVALGPLTNIALALEADPDALRGVGRIVAMAGAVDVPGNVTADAEFNAHTDPEAAARVVAAGLALDLVPLDATRQATLYREELDAALSRRPGPVAERVRAFTRRTFRLDGGAMHLHDPLAVAVAIDPSLVAWEPVRLAVGAGGETRRVAGPANCRFAARVDRARFLAMFLERLCPASPSPRAS